MDGLSLLKRLGSGAKFNLKRFKEDAERIKVIFITNVVKSSIIDHIFFDMCGTIARSFAPKRVQSIRATIYT